METVDSEFPTPKRDIDKPFMIPLEHSYSIPGRGTVVTGRVERGICKKGDPLELLGFNKTIKTTANGIEMFKKSLDRAEAGDQLGILLRGIKREEVRRGMSLIKPGTGKLYNHFQANVYLLTKEEGGRNKPLTKKFQTIMYSKTWDMPTRVNFPDGDESRLIMPGENAVINITLHKGMMLEKGQRFQLRDSSQTIGSGVVTEFLPSKSEKEIGDLWE